MKRNTEVSPVGDGPVPVAGIAGEGTRAVMAADGPEATNESFHPDRYVVHESGEDRYLCCVEVPEVRVIFDGSAVANEAAVRKAPPGTVFLDGAALAPPFLDAEREVFNLDHHVGCVRQFTVAACEQALILVLRGLDLGARPWIVHATQPDLDAVLAIWVLLNASRIQALETEARQRLIQLVRLESVIDVHGLGLAELSGLGAAGLQAATSAMASLRQRELALKETGDWDSVDMPEHIAGVLREIDTLIFPAGSLPQPVSFEVLARATLGDALILVCRAEQGVYEVESGLKQVYGKRLAILALEIAPHKFTLRLVNPFHGRNLHAVYDELNGLDPAVVRGGWRDSWGGSGEIGGSPRKAGTALEPREIAEACRQALRSRSPVQKVAALGASVALSAIVLVGGKLMSWLATGSRTLPLSAEESFPFAIGFGVLAAILLTASGLWKPRAFGLQRLVRGDWLYCVPVGIAAALAGGVWRVDPVAGTALGTHLGTLALLALGAEFLFRGVAHGVLGRGFRVTHAGGRWLLSVPIAFCALLYAGAGTLLPLAGSPFQLGGSTAHWLSTVVASVLFGLTAGLARERSGSILAPGLLHLCGLVLCEFIA
jgi:hypothetical protein